MRGPRLVNRRLQNLLYAVHFQTHAEIVDVSVGAGEHREEDLIRHAVARRDRRLPVAGVVAHGRGATRTRGAKAVPERKVRVIRCLFPGLVGIDVEFKVGKPGRVVGGRDVGLGLGGDVTDDEVVGREVLGLAPVVPGDDLNEGRVDFEGVEPGGVPKGVTTPEPVFAEGLREEPGADGVHVGLFGVAGGGDVGGVVRGAVDGAVGPGVPGEEALGVLARVVMGRGRCVGRWYIPVYTGCVEAFREIFVAPFGQKSDGVVLCVVGPAGGILATLEGADDSFVIVLVLTG